MYTFCADAYPHYSFLSPNDIAIKLPALVSSYYHITKICDYCITQIKFLCECRCCHVCLSIGMHVYIFLTISLATYRRLFHREKKNDNAV